MNWLYLCVWWVNPNEHLKRHRRRLITNTFETYVEYIFARLQWLQMRIKYDNMFDKDPLSTIKFNKLLWRLDIQMEWGKISEHNIRMPYSSVTTSTQTVKETIRNGGREKIGTEHTLIRGFHTNILTKISHETNLYMKRSYVWYTPTIIYDLWWLYNYVDILSILNINVK